MKHCTYKAMMVIPFISLFTSAHGQDVFTLSQDYTKQMAPVHRGIPAFGDFNSDGLYDIYYGGQGLEKTMPFAYDSLGVVKDASWWTVGNLAVNKGKGLIDMQRAWCADWSGWYYGGVVKTNGAHGLPPSTFQKSVWFDYNNDGNLDILIHGKNEYGWEPTDKSVYPDGYYTYLFANTGETGNPDSTYYFNMNPNLDLPQANNEVDVTNNTNYAMADYDHDGYVDILTMCYNKWFDGDEQKGGRLVGLYHNNGNGTFTKKAVFKPIPYESNPQPKGLFTINEETLEATPTYEARPMSHGAVAFGDLNNDGYADIVTMGYSDDGPSLTMYRNNGDGTFQEVALDKSIFTNGYEGDIVMADFNNDGLQDVLVFGTPEDGSEKHADIYFNDGDFNFHCSSRADGNGLYGYSQAGARVCDLNHDGLLDVVVGGWGQEYRDWAIDVFLQNADGTFSHAQRMPHWPSAGGFDLGDINGDGAADFALLGYGWSTTGQTNSTSFDIMLNTNTEGAIIPDAPTNVKVEDKGDSILISWAGDENNPGYGYNLYVKNTDNGWLSQLIPANTDNGKLLTCSNLAAALHSTEPGSMSYTMKKPALASNIEVGVQAIAPDYNASAFTKVQTTIATGISTLPKSVSSSAIDIYGIDGTTIAKNVSADQVSKLNRGVYILKSGKTVTKIVKR